MHLTENSKHSGLYKEGFTSLSCEILWSSWQTWNHMVVLLCEVLRDPGSFQLCSAITGHCAYNFHGQNRRLVELQFICSSGTPTVQAAIGERHKEKGAKPGTCNLKKGFLKPAHVTSSLAGAYSGGHTEMQGSLESGISNLHLS